MITELAKRFRSNLTVQGVQRRRQLSNF